MDRIPVSGPWITEKEVQYVADAAAHGWYSTANHYPARFEKAFAEHTGSKHAVCLPSCTSAIHLSLLAMGVGPGDEVIVPDLTWIASAAPITYVGATTVFADVDPLTWCLSPTSLQSCITPRTKAIIPVHLYGNMAAMDRIREIATTHQLRIIEDAAEATGSTYQNRPAGSFGDTGVFSFHGSKTMTTGEGGMLVTNDDELWKRICFLRDHGRPPGDRFFYNTEVAWKYKMSALQAALGLAQLERLNELVERKREIFRWYHEQLSGLSGCTLNPEPPGTYNSYWMVTLVLEPALGWTKQEIMQELDKQQIDSRPFFHPLSSIPAFKDRPEAAAAAQRNIESYRISPHGINLPSALNLTRDQVLHVCQVIRSILGKPHPSR